MVIAQKLKIILELVSYLAPVSEGKVIRNEEWSITATVREWLSGVVCVRYLADFRLRFRFLFFITVTIAITVIILVVIIRVFVVR